MNSVNGQVGESDRRNPRIKKEQDRLVPVLLLFERKRRIVDADVFAETSAENGGRSNTTEPRKIPPAEEFDPLLQNDYCRGNACRRDDMSNNFRHRRPSVLHAVS